MAARTDASVIDKTFHGEVKTHPIRMAEVPHGRELYRIRDRAGGLGWVRNRGESPRMAQEQEPKLEWGPNTMWLRHGWSGCQSWLDALHAEDKHNLGGANSNACCDQANTGHGWSTFGDAEPPQEQHSRRCGPTQIK
jgi:hypothetical protein